MKHSVLDEIVANRKTLLSATAWSVGIPSKSEYSLADSLRESQQGIIFECKKKSPSRGLLSDNYQPDQIASHYADFAAGISVLTEPDYFAGSPEHLRAVRKAVALPVLAKDFVVDLKQITEARALGADVILLMLSVVDDAFWKQAYQAATDLDMDVLTEVHDESELKRAINLGAPIIGINNRDLHSLTTNLDVTRKLAPMIPSDRIIISESGIASYQDLQSLSSMVHGFLIGTSMMQSGHLNQALRKLIFSEVKICGLTNFEDAKTAYTEGASWGGIIFTPVSKRYQTPEQAADWANHLQLPLIGVFMDQPIDEIVAVLDQVPLAGVQLHGRESIEFISELRTRIPETIQIWKTLTASDTSAEYPSATELKSEINDWFAGGVDKILVDKPKNRPTDALDFNALAGLENVLLAGGINLDSDILKSGTRLAGLDICSGVESEPGKKDHTLIHKIFKVLEVKTRND